MKINNIVKQLLLILILSTQTVIYAQNQSVNLKRGITLKEAFIEIEKQTNLSVDYNSNILDPNQKTDKSFTNEQLKEVLPALLSGSNCSYKLQGNHILIQSVKEEKRTTVTGKITDERGESVIGANVMEKGTTNGTTTDIDGAFSIDVKENAVLQISYLGYLTQEIAVKNQQIIVTSLQEDSQNLEEVVVVGYTTMKKASLTGSISSVKVDEQLRSISSSNVSSVLAGTMAGLRVNNRSGVPGVASEINIRTAGTWNSSPPIYVVDGVVREKSDFDRIDVNEIENITILKDAASAAIYGSRSSGGVILVSTRQGYIGKPQIRYTGSYAVEGRGMEMDVTSGIETAELANYIHRNNQGFWVYWDDDELEHIRNLNGGKGYSVIDDYWKNPMSTHHSLTLSGGSEKIKYFINGSYFNQSGFLDKMDYSRYNVRSNLEASITSSLKLITQLFNSFEDRNNISYAKSSDMSGLYTHMRCIQPEMRSRTSDGKPVDWGWIGNIGEFSNPANSGYNKDENQVSEVLFRLEYDIPFVKGLKAKGQFAYNYQNFYNKTFNRKQDLYQVKKEGTNGHIWTDEIIGVAKSSEPSKEYLYQSSARRKGYQLNLQLDYARTFGKHDVMGLFVYEQTEKEYRNFYGARENFPILIKDQWFATSSARTDSYIDGSDSEDGRLSYIGQVNYTYDNKYLLNASLRVDGSMNFPKGKQYGYFPAASGAWIVSNEKFFSSKIIDMLKLKASIGLTGNDNVIGWQWQESYKPASSAYFGTSPSTKPGIAFGGVVNPNITWEKSLSYNIGTEVYLLNQITFGADFWFKKTYDILGERVQSLPTSFGYKMPSENYGKVHSKGLDIEVSYKNNVKDLNYYVKGIFSYSTNKVKVKDYAEDAPDYENPIGRPLGYIKGYRDAGIIRNQQQLDELNQHYKDKFGADHEFTVFGNKTELGMLVYKDLSGPNGVPDGKIDSYDQDVICKYSVPPVSAGLTLGLEWKGLSMETLLQGDFGYKRGLDWRYLGFYEWSRMPRKWLNHWSEENPNGRFPEPKGSDSFKSYNAISTFTIHNASFVKMRYLNIGYSLPKEVLRPLGFIGSAKLFFSATNLLTFTKFDYWDPELNGTGSYPNMKTFNFGIDLIF